MINRDKVLQDTYNNVAKLGFGDLVLLQAQLSEHILNCWQHHQLQMETAKETLADPKPDSRPFDA